MSLMQYYIIMAVSTLIILACLMALQKRLLKSPFEAPVIGILLGLSTYAFCYASGYFVFISFAVWTLINLVSLFLILKKRQNNFLKGYLLLAMLSLFTPILIWSARTLSI